MLHLGNARAALFSALYAKKEQGIFLLRIEDTDVSRSDEKYIDILQNDLIWLGLHWQEGPGKDGGNGPYWQSHRQKIYDSYYQQLETQNRAYPCFCTEQELAIHRKLQQSRGQPPRYSGLCRKLTKEQIAARLVAGEKPALRFLVPEHAVIEFMDLVKGSQHFKSDYIGDFIIRRADGTSSFMFCNAIDDSLMGVTHVIRGEDHLTNTPRQLMILQALGLRTAQYGHLSLITGDDGAPLSKRHGSFSLHDLREQGYLPIAVANYLARLSHAYDEQKLMDFSELAQRFQLEKISRASARFDKNQLLHWQKEVVMAMDAASCWQWIGEDIKNTIPYASQGLFIELAKNNFLFPEEIKQFATILFGEKLHHTEDNIAILKSTSKDLLTKVLEGIEQYDTDFPSLLNFLKSEVGLTGKQLYMPIRIALTGEQHGPELAKIAVLLGKERLKERFHSALLLLGK